MLEVSELNKSYSSGNIFSRKKKVKVLEDISFSISKHETLCIVGESGCGKTTLAKCLVNLEKPDSGKVILEDTDITFPDRNLNSFVSSNIQMVFQNPDTSLNPKKRIYDIMAEPLILQKRPKKNFRKIILEVLDHVGLSEKHLMSYPHQLSGGQNQRIAIARAIILRPTLLIADEVTSALDVSIQAQIIHLLIKLKKEMGMTLIFICHDLILVKRIADRVAVMQEGKIVEINTKDQIFHKPQHQYTQKLVNDMEKLSMKLPESDNLSSSPEFKKNRICYT